MSSDAVFATPIRFRLSNASSQCVCSFPIYMRLRNASAPPNASLQCLCATQCVFKMRLRLSMRLRLPSVFTQFVFRARLRLLMRLRLLDLFLNECVSLHDADASSGRLPHPTKTPQCIFGHSIFGEQVMRPSEASSPIPRLQACQMSQLAAFKTKLRPELRLRGLGLEGGSEPQYCPYPVQVLCLSQALKLCISPLLQTSGPA